MADVTTVVTGKQDIEAGMTAAQAAAAAAAASATSAQGQAADAANSATSAAAVLGQVKTSTTQAAANATAAENNANLAEGHASDAATSAAAAAGAASSAQSFFAAMTSSYSVQPASGDTVQVPNSTATVFIEGDVTLASLTVLLPPEPTPGLHVSVVFEVAVTEMTLEAPQGYTINNPILNQSFGIGDRIVTTPNGTKWA